MSNHNFTRPGGVWNSDTDLLPAELADLDAKTVDSLSATGGTYVLTSDMVIGDASGQLWDFNIETAFHDQATFWGLGQFVGGADVYDHLTVAALATFDSQVFFNDVAFFVDQARFQDAALFFADTYFQDIVTFNGNIDANGVTDISGALNVSGPSSFTGAVDFNAGGVDINTALLIAGGAVVFGNDGRIPKRQVIGVNAPFTNYSPLSADHVHFPAGTLTGADINAKIDDTGAVNGDHMRFSTNDTSTAVVQILNPANSVIAKIKYNSVGDCFAVDVERISGTWRIVGASHKPAV